MLRTRHHSPSVVTVCAGAKQNVLSGLTRYGVTPKLDFEIVQAFPADLPPQAPSQHSPRSEVLTGTYVKRHRMARARHVVFG
jgi:hypothetical protein